MYDGECTHSPVARTFVYAQRTCIAKIGYLVKSYANTADAYSTHGSHEEHKSNLPLTQGELRIWKSRFPNLKIVGTLWGLTPKEPDFKARLGLQGCQEDPSMMRTDSPAGSRDSCFLVLSCAAQEHWSCGSADAASAHLQAGGIERLLLLMMPKRQPPPGCEPGEVRVVRGSIFGIRDAGRSWYQHLRD